MSVNKIVITRLFQSFGELERAIASAKQALEGKQTPPQELLERIDSYEQILLKQRRLAEELCGFANSGNWGGVERNIKVINGLSQMIRDDAREVVAGLRAPLSVEERELMLS